MSRVSELTARPAAHDPASSAGSAGALAGRLMLVALFVFSGLAKVQDPQAVIVEIQAIGLPFPELGLLAAVAVELGGSAMLLAGYRTQLAAAAMAAFCVVTAALFHNHWSDPDQLLHFLKDISIAGGLLQVSVFGAGRWSLDAWRARAGWDQGRGAPVRPHD